MNVKWNFHFGRHFLKPQMEKKSVDIKKWWSCKVAWRVQYFFFKASEWIGCNYDWFIGCQSMNDKSTTKNYVPFEISFDINVTLDEELFDFYNNSLSIIATWLEIRWHFSVFILFSNPYLLFMVLFIAWRWIKKNEKSISESEILIFISKLIKWNYEYILYLNFGQQKLFLLLFFLAKPLSWLLFFTVQWTMHIKSTSTKKWIESIFCIYE